MRPAATATATGAAESHSYWPPECRYTSPSPGRPPSSWRLRSPSARARRREHLGHLRATCRWAGAADEHPQRTVARRGEPEASPGRRSREPGPRREGRRPRSRAIPSITRATWTAKSLRSSEYSRVPSRGSTIHMALAGRGHGPRLGWSSSSETTHHRAVRRSQLPAIEVLVRAPVARFGEARSGRPRAPDRSSRSRRSGFAASLECEFLVGASTVAPRYAKLGR